MSNITYVNQRFDCKEQENLLDAFFRNKIDVPFSCRNGTCQACLIQATEGEIPEASQAGLSQHLKDSKHLLPCRCYPTTDMQLSPPNIDDIFSLVNIKKLTLLSDNIMLVEIEITEPVDSYKTGQFINIKTHLDNKIRSYSIANIFNTSSSLEIHVQKIDVGTFSSWIFEDAKPTDEIFIHYPLGACFASDNFDISGKLLIATGSGLGATFAIAQEALEKGYKGSVCLFHGVKNSNNIYLTDKIQELASKYKNFKFYCCTTNKASAYSKVEYAYVDELAFQKFDNLEDWEVYIYGNPVMVKSGILKASTLGCRSNNIICDAFEYGQSAQYNKSAEQSNAMEFIEEPKRNFKPDPKMWEALGEGVKLNQILNNFYDKVLDDPLLSPFFTGVTKEHIVGKQYAFLNQIYTGKDCYFGDRPRNAHQWMIISDSLFDHREKLFADSCIKCGLQEPFLSQILAFDETYRNVIVKTKVWPRIMDGEIKAIKGFEEMYLDIGSICDGCEKELDPGTKVHYHDRTGEMFCEECNSSNKS